MTPAAAYDDLIARAKRLAVVQSCAGVLGWDQQTFMPKGAAGLRGEQLTSLAAIAHTQATDPILGERLAAVEGSDLVADPTSIPAANVRELRHGYDRATKLPARLVEELARVTTAAHEAWQEARAANHFPTFRPHLEKVVALKREEAQAVGYRGHPYDALLDEFEPGATAAEVAAIFAELRTHLVPMLQSIAASGKKPRTDILTADYPIDRQKWFAESAAAALGFDFHAGRIDVAAHPFCAAFGPGDCRLTTRYNPKFFPEAFFGVLHEVGHGLYELGLPAEHFGTPCGTYCSLGVHESQSEHFFPRLRQAFPGPLRDVRPDEFAFAINEVKPSFIRVEADEATYNLHIVLRFELELDLLSENLTVAELPGAWNEKFEKSLGLKIHNDRDGCLQDVHWSGGGLGYFPTYTLGNLLAAQLMSSARKELGADSLDENFRRGQFAPLLNWLRTKIHGQGRRYRATELCRQATGNPLTIQPFLSYLSEKLARFYSVC